LLDEPLDEPLHEPLHETGATFEEEAS